VEAPFSLMNFKSVDLNLKYQVWNSLCWGKKFCVESSFSQAMCSTMSKQTFPASHVEARSGEVREAQISQALIYC